MRYRFPRLRQALALRHVDKLRGSSLEDVRDSMVALHAAAYWAEVGPMKVPQDRLEVAVERVRSIAADLGWPNPIRSTAEFDSALTRELRSLLPMPVAEFGAGEVWNHVTCAMLLDVAAWRWPKAWAKSTDDERGDPNERFLGHKIWRNTFSRYYARSIAFQTTSPSIVDAIGEDARVQLTERGEGAKTPQWVRVGAETSLLAQAHWNGLTEKPRLSDGSKLSTEDMVRESIKRARRLPPWTCIEAMPHEQIIALVRTQFDAVVANTDGPSIPWDGLAHMLSDHVHPPAGTALTTTDPLALVIAELEPGHLLCPDELVNRIGDRVDLDELGGSEAILGAIDLLAADGLIEDDGDKFITGERAVWYRTRDTVEVRPLPIKGRSFDWIATAELTVIAAHFDSGRTCSDWLDAVSASTGIVVEGTNEQRLRHAWNSAGRS
jgi:hypothetical protein